LNSNNGIAISKKLLDGKNAMLNVPLLHYSQAEWGGRRTSLSWLLPISKTCVLFAPPSIN